MRKLRPAHVVAGALMLAIPGSAVALAAGQANAQGAIQISVSSRHLAFGEALRVTGTASSAGAGRTIVLAFAQRGAKQWQRLESTTARGDGSFRFRTPLKRSGLVRVIATSPTSSGASSVAGSGTISPSPSRPIVVRSQFDLRSHSLDALAGQSVTVRGRLLPEVGGRKVYLEGRSGRHWHWLATGGTGRHGGFRIHYRAGGLGSEHLRVRFMGDKLNSRNLHGAGSLTVFRQSLASWYSDGGSTACGFHAGMGVANKTLPCGTKVTFRYGGRTVTATVDDRGPYVGGREWDLNQNTAGALGFNGVGTVWSSR
jgi:rare lipoprotein A